jgi:hypothetical protein
MASVFACSGKTAVTLPSNINSEARVTESPQKEASPIRAIDFERLEYPRYRLPSGTAITLRPGETAPAHISFGDVTGDAVEEALVVLGERTRGTAVLHHVYVFGLVERESKLLWDFETCDRADGGLRQVYARGGRLVVELYGRGKVLGTNLCRDDGTRKEDPYPYAVTRTEFEWINGSFQQVSEMEFSADPETYGSPIMSRYEKRR